MMTDNFRKRLQTANLVILDLFILTVCLFESNFWAVVLDERLTVSNLLKNSFETGELVTRLDPISPSIEGGIFLAAVPFLTALMVSLLYAGALFFVIKLVLSACVKQIENHFAR